MFLFYVLVTYTEHDYQSTGGNIVYHVCEQATQES